MSRDDDLQFEFEPLPSDPAAPPDAPPPEHAGDVDMESLPRCPGCGYVVYKVSAPRCPECGRELHPWEMRRTTREDRQSERIIRREARLQIAGAVMLLVGLPVTMLRVVYGSPGGSCFVIPLALGTVMLIGFRYLDLAGDSLWWLVFGLGLLWLLAAVWLIVPGL